MEYRYANLSVIETIDPTVLPHCLNATEDENCTSCWDEDKYPVAQAFLRLNMIGPLALFGIAANLINIFIFSRKEMRASLTNWFLLTLAASDCLLLIATLNMLSLPVLAEKLESLALTQAGHQLTRWVYPLGNLFQTLSIYMVVMVSAHRYLGICRPFWAQQHATKSNIKRTIILTICFAVIFTMVRWGTLIIVPCYSVTFQTLSYKVYPSSWTQSFWFTFVYGVVMYILVMFLFPFTALCILSHRLVLAVKKSRQMRNASKPPPRLEIGGSPRFSDIPSGEVISTSLIPSPLDDDPSEASLLQARPANGRPTDVRLSPNRQHITAKLRRFSRRRPKKPSQRDNTDQRKEQSITVMLVSIVFLFLICNSLPFCNNIFDVLLQQTDLFHGNGTDENTIIQIRTYFTFLVEFGNFLVTINSSAYIIVYLIFNRKYRQLVEQIILRRKPVGSGGGTSVGGSRANPIKKIVENGIFSEKKSGSSWGAKPDSKVGKKLSLSARPSNLSVANYQNGRKNSLRRNTQSLGLGAQNSAASKAASRVKMNGCDVDSERLL